MLRAALLLVLGLPALEGCAFFTRFSQESYVCETPAAPFERVAFSRLEAGAPFTVEGLRVPGPFAIAAVSEAEIELRSGEQVIRINRESGAVQVIAAARALRFNCKKAAFRM